ncbi:tail assembly protein [Silvimonas sp.]|uniref:tail assembly protein n=1 Tax=Silvimonas sp. TaxID=2650811 RepID=UPI00283D3348|nr:tail assembly protein [Silvimonas sp.]MDR3427904.1 tail assembly protein [Silvimonas sp.]
METLRTIRLYGKLGARFGRIHRLAVASAAEAVRALSMLLPGFEGELMSSKDRGLAYAVFLGKRNLAPDQLRYPVGADEIRIAPILQGSKRGGILQTILGVVLIVVGVYLENPQLVGMGVGMVAGGVLQMLSPVSPGLSTKDGPDNGASYNFNGAVNTTAQGNPVPLLYGRMIVGSAVISAGIYAEDQQ